MGDQIESQWSRNKESMQGGKQRPLVAKNIHKEFGDRVVLADETISINPGDRIALVGRNGSGKSTLIRILGGYENPDSGEVFNQNLKIGYLPQDFHFDQHKTVYEVATEGVSEIVNALGQFEDMTANFNLNDPDFVERYSKVQSILDASDGYNINERVRQMLDQLGIHRPFDATVATLSGGEEMRLALVRLLLADPDILLLDEPTNHLDLDANLWLREFLNNWSGGLLVVSHDRDFLNDVTNMTWELNSASIRPFGGNYEFYKEQKGIEAEAREREMIRLNSEVRKASRQIQKEQQRAAHSARKDLSKKPEDHDRFRAHFFKEKATKTAGKKKKLSEDKRDDLSGQLNEMRTRKTPTMDINIRETESHKGKLLIQTNNASFGYDGTTLVEDVDLHIHFGNRLALFGRNGSGKTTLVNGLFGARNVSVEGTVKKTEKVNTQVLDQRYLLVDRSKTVLQNMSDAAPDMNDADLRDHLSKFMFFETTEVNKPASVLSGGEIARLSLALIATMPIDLLVLDEPTNNLDVESIEEIEGILKTFKGAMLVISHDLSFLRNIGIDSSYVISDRKLKRLASNPEDHEYFKDELLLYW